VSVKGGLGGIIVNEMKLTIGIKPVGGGEKGEERDDVPIGSENMVHSFQFRSTHYQLNSDEVTNRN